MKGKIKIDSEGKPRVLYHIIMDDDSNIFFSSELFTQLYKAVSKGLINSKAIDEALKDYLSDNDIRTLFNDDNEKALVDLKRKFHMLSAFVEEECNKQIKTIQAKEEKLKGDSFIEGFAPNFPMTITALSKYSGLSRNTITSNIPKLKVDGKNYNVRSFLTLIKANYYKNYERFQKNWLESENKK